MTLINGSTGKGKAAEARLASGHIDALRAAVQGYMMEHGAYPDFILMTSDVAQAVFQEVENNRQKYGGLIRDQLGTTGSVTPIHLNFGPPGGIEIGQIVGINRVEMVGDPSVYKAKRSMGVT